MPTLKSLAVVLATRDFGESDRLVELFTERLGRLSCVARGAKRSKKRFANTLESFSLIEVLIFEKTPSSLPLLKEARLKEPYIEIRSDTVKAAWASLILELSKRLTALRDPDPRLFRLVVAGLERFKEEQDPLAGMVLFTLRFLALAGLGPELARCVVCSEDPLSRGSARFSPGEGGIMCPGHGKAGFEMSPGTARLLARAEGTDPETLWRLRPTRSSRPEALKVMVELVRHHLGEEPKTFRVLRQLGALPPEDRARP